MKRIICDILAIATIVTALSWGTGTNIKPVNGAEDCPPITDTHIARTVINSAIAA